MTLSASPTVDAPTAMVCAADHLAAQAGLAVLREGGNAVDAAVATNAVLAVVTQQMCGMGGDLLAVISRPGEPPVALNASGFAGAGANADALRAAGHRAVPRHALAAVTVPGCVDGWVHVVDTYGTMPLSRLLAPAEAYARLGFPASPPLVAALPAVAHDPASADFRPGVLRPGDRVVRPGIARALRDVMEGGRAAFYEGEFGAGLRRLAPEQFSSEDLSRPIAGVVAAISAPAFGNLLWSVPPNSQGYLTLAAGAIASRLPLPDDPDSDLWAHLLIESLRQAAYDREDVLAEDIDPAELLDPERLETRRNAIDPDRAAILGDAYGAGETTAFTVIDGDRMGVTFVQSNASGFGARIAEPSTGIFLHNRGLGFSLQRGHPAELAPGRRPPHTLSPTVVTTREGTLAGTIGTAGGDSQPQFLLQLLARWLGSGARPGEAMAAGRFSLVNPDGGDFNAWGHHGRVRVLLEEHAAPAWATGLMARGHVVDRTTLGHELFGIAHMITVTDGGLSGAADPRGVVGAAVGY